MPILVTYTEAAGNVHNGPGFYFKNILRPGFGLRPLVQAGNPPSISDPVTPVAWAAGTYAPGATAIDANNNIVYTPGGGTASGSLTANPIYGGNATDGGIMDWITSMPSWVWKAVTPVIYDQQVRAASGNIWQCIQAGITKSSSAPSDTGVPYGGIIPDGTAIWMNLGPTVTIGSHEGALDWQMGSKGLEIVSDSFSAPVETRTTEEMGGISGTLQELLPLNVSKSLAATVYSTGTDPNFPADAQLYQQLTFGMALRVPHTCDLLLSYRPNFGNSSLLSTQPFKYFGGCLYKAAPTSDGKIGFQLKKASQYKVDMKGHTVTWRPAGDTLGQFWEQI